jgi:hypothetical protein
LKKIFLFIFCIGFYSGLQAQQGAFSIATDVSGLSNFTPGQRFFTFGQSVQGNFHITKRQSIYVLICYYLNAKSSNTLTAIAKDPFTDPQTITYTSTSTHRYRQFSTGFKHYLKGTYDNEESWNLYGIAGFGLLFGQVENEYNQTIDSSRYIIPQKAIAGTGDFKRLTFDLGAGVEMMLGSSIYLYAEARTWIQASDYPSPYLYNNDMPRTLSLNTGIRILID